MFIPQEEEELIKSCPKANAVACTSRESQFFIPPLRFKLIKVNNYNFSIKALCYVFFKDRLSYQPIEDLPSWDEWNELLLKQDMNHEVGHCLGLGHSPDASYIMFSGEGGVRYAIYPHPSEIELIKDKLQAK